MQNGRLVAKRQRIKNIVTVTVFMLILFSIFFALLFKNDKEISESERRPLAQAPTLSYKSIVNGEYFDDFEDYALDQFVLRDTFRSIKAMSAYGLLGMKDNNELYYFDGGIYKIERMNSESFTDAGKKIQALAEKYADMNLYYAIIPDKNTLVSDESHRPGMDIALADELLSKSITSCNYIDIAALLTRNDYYATDLHWDQSKILPIANALLSSMGRGGNLSDEDFDRVELFGFKGSYFGQIALPLKGETLTYLTSDALAACTVTDLSSGKELLLYDEEAFKGVDSYNLFVGGTQPLLSIRNTNAANDRKLYLFRDSFGSSIAPLLVGEYAEIVLIDIRYVDSDYLDYFVEFEAGSDMLFLFSMHVLNQSTMLR